MASSEFGLPEPSRPSIPDPGESAAEPTVKPAAEPTAQRADGLAPGEPTLLESVLRRTAALTNAEEPVDDEEMAAVEQVARRLKGHAFALDPVVVDLVGAMLLVEFGRQWTSPGLWEVVSRRIARTLFEDPTSRARLETLWARLSGSFS